MPVSKGYSFGVKPRDAVAKISNTPGPLDYTTASYSRFGKFSSPSYSIKSKGRSKENRTETPGPLDYQNQTALSNMKTTTSYSFGVARRREPFSVKSDTPPPNKYSVPSTIGNNAIDKKKTGGSYSMQGRQKNPRVSNVTPGPGAYDPVNIHLYKKKEPTVPFTGRRQPPFHPSDPMLPGPSQYDTLRCRIDKIKGRCAPRACFGIKHSPKKFTVFTHADISE